MVLIQLGHEREQIVLAGVGRETMQLAFNSHPFTRATFVANVDFAGRIFAHQHGRQTGHGSVVLNEIGHLLGDLRLNLGGYRLAVKQRSCHRSAFQGLGKGVGMRQTTRAAGINALYITGNQVTGDRNQGLADSLASGVYCSTAELYLQVSPLKNLSKPADAVPHRNRRLPTNHRP